MHRPSNPTKMSRNLPVDHRWLAVELNKSSVPEIVCLIVFLGFDPYVAAISGPYGLIKALWWVSLPNPLPTSSTLCAWGKLITLSFTLLISFCQFVYHPGDNWFGKVKCLWCYTTAHPMGQSVIKNQYFEVMTPSTVPFHMKNLKKAAESHSWHPKVIFHFHFDIHVCSQDWDWDI